MKIIKSIRSLQTVLKKERAQGRSIGFVPTMGYFHEGHLSLMRRGRKENDCLVVSVFVNPAQFGPREDYERYPRDVKRDEALARREQVDYVFCPSVSRMYPPSYGTYVFNDTISNILCGVSRPGHFRGVATVVAKLFNIVQPDRAYFGQKDYQQLCVIRQLVRDLNFNIALRQCPIVREKDGLAMSSRNKYLSEDGRSRARALYESLQSAKDAVRGGERDPGCIIKKVKKVLALKVDTIDYIAVLRADNLQTVEKVSGKTFIGVAAYIGPTRLIDNVILNC